MTFNPTFSLLDSLLESLRVQSEVQQRVGKKQRVKNPHLGTGEDSDDDENFDMQGALAVRGLHIYDRPEHIDKKHYAPSKQACEAAFRRGTPWISDRTNSFLKDFAPQPTDRFNMDPTAAKRAIDRMVFVNFVHFQRHNRTWATFHVAVGALSLSDAVWWLAECEEICDSKGENIAIRCAMTRLNAAKEAVATFRRPIAQPPKEDAISHAKGFLGTFLRHRDKVLEELRDRQQENRYRHRSRSPRRPFLPPPPPPQSDNHQRIAEVRVPLDQQICLAHNQKDGKTCQRQQTCKRAHLDTTREEDVKKFKDVESTIARVRGRGSRHKVVL